LIVPFANTLVIGCEALTDPPSDQIHTHVQFKTKLSLPLSLEQPCHSLPNSPWSEFYCINCSEFLVLTSNIPRMSVSEEKAVEERGTMLLW